MQTEHTEKDQTHINLQFQFWIQNNTVLSTSNFLNFALWQANKEKDYVFQTKPKLDSHSQVYKIETFKYNQ